MKNVSIYKYWASLSIKKVSYYNKKVVSVLVLVAFLFNCPIASSVSIDAQICDLQQPTMISSWDIPGLRGRAILAYFNYYIRDIVSDPKNQNISSMKAEIQKMIKTYYEDPAVPGDIKKYRLISIEDEKDHAFRVNFGSGIYMRFYNPMIEGADIPMFNDKSNNLEVQELTFAKKRQNGFNYLRRQRILLKEPWYDREVDLKINKQRIRKELEAISRYAEDIMPFFIGEVQRDSYSVLGPLDEMDRIVNELKQSPEQIQTYIEGFRFFEELMSEKEVNPEILEKYVITYYEFLRDRRPDSRSMAGNRSQFPRLTTIINDIFSQEDERKITSDPISYAVETFIEVLSSHEFNDYNHRVACFLMNFILVKNGYPCFSVKVSNIEQYCRRTSIVDIMRGGINIQKLKDFFRKEILSNEYGRGKEEDLSVKSLDKGRSPWYNRYIYVRFPKEKMKKRISSAIQLSDEIAESVLEGKKSLNIPKTGNVELDRDIMKHYKNLLARGIKNIEVDKYVGAMDIFYQMLGETDMTLDKFEKYILEFQKGNMGQSKTGYIKDPEHTRKEFRRILSELFNERGQDEIKENIFFYVSVIFTDILYLHPFENGNHRIADLVINYILLKNGYAPFLISEDNIVEYYKLFNSLAVREGDLNIFDISEFFKKQTQKKISKKYLPAPWNNAPGKKEGTSYINNAADHIMTVLSDLPISLKGELFRSKKVKLNKESITSGLELFFKVLQEDILDGNDLGAYIRSFYKRMYKGFYYLYKNGVVETIQMRPALEYNILERIIHRTIEPEAQGSMFRDPVAYGVKVFHAILKVNYLPRGNHEIGLFVLNLMLARSGNPYFFISPYNAARYYDMFNRKSIRQEEHSLLEMIDFVKGEITGAYKDLIAGKDRSIGAALYFDHKKDEVRELKGEPDVAGSVSEHDALNKALRKVIFDKEKKPLASDDKLVEFLSELEHPAAKKVNVYIFKKKDLKQELGEFAYLATGLITHAGTNNGQTYNLFIPEYIYSQMLYLLEYDPVNSDISLILSLWGYHELNHLEEIPETGFSEEMETEAGVQLWLYSNAKMELENSIKVNEKKLKRKILRSAAKKIKKAKDYRHEYFFIYEMEGRIYREIAINTRKNTDFSQALSGFTIALSDLAVMEEAILEEHHLVYDILDLLEIWSGKRGDGVMPKKARNHLADVIKNVLRSDAQGKAEPTSLKKIKHIVDEQVGTDSLNDPFFPKFSMLPVVVQYLKKYQKKDPDRRVLKDLSIAVGRDIPVDMDEEYKKRVKPWDDLRAKIYHFCGTAFMRKEDHNSMLNASLCFEKEAACDSRYPEVYLLLAQTRLTVDRSEVSVESLKNIIIDGIDFFGHVDVIEAALELVNEADKVNDEVYEELKKTFDAGLYDECLSGIKLLEKKYHHADLGPRITDLKEDSKELKTNKKAAQRAIKDGRLNEAARIFKSILQENPTDMSSGEANVKVLLDIEEKERRFIALDEHEAHGAAARPVKERLVEVEKYIAEAKRFVKDKGRISRARQRYDLAFEEIMAAETFLLQENLNDHDLRYFKKRVRDVEKKVETGLKNIEGLPDRVVVKKEQERVGTKKRKKKNSGRKNENKKAYNAAELSDEQSLPNVFISKEILKTLEEMPERNVLSNNIVSGFTRILSNSFTRKKKWRAGKDNVKISRMRLGRHFRLFYTTTAKGDLMALSIIRKSDSKYMNLKLKDLSPKGDGVDELEDTAISLEAFKKSIQENNGSRSAKKEKIKADKKNSHPVDAVPDILAEKDKGENTKKGEAQDLCWETDQIISNARRIIPRLIQAMIKLSCQVSEENVNRKVVILLDTDLTELSGDKIKAGLEDLIDTLSVKKIEKRSLSLFLSNLEIRKGSGKDLLSKMGNVSEKDLMVLTGSMNYDLFTDLEKKGALLTVLEREYEGEVFPSGAYLPLVEVLFLSMVKYMYINSDEDLTKMLIDIYDHIPNVIALEDLKTNEYRGIIDKETNKMLIRLLPEAKKFASSDFTDPMDRILEFLVKA